jgi:dTDP-4-amino-4,6-dideoxygalactose transaminase
MILMNNFNAEPEELRRRELEAVERVLDSGWFILGKEVEQFEGAWGKFSGARFCSAPSLYQLLAQFLLQFESASVAVAR